MDIEAYAGLFSVYARNKINCGLSFEFQAISTKVQLFAAVCTVFTYICLIYYANY